jgi:hypothetical protein
MIKYETREQYLNAAVGLMKPLFDRNGSKLPKVRVSTGWPSKSALASKNRRIGECWDKTASSDGVFEMFISPCLDKVAEPQGVLDTLVHECVHAAVGLECGHKGPFRKLATKLGLEGKMTSTHAGEQLLAEIKAWVAQLGDYPHAKLDLTKSPRKKQGTRMIKCECGQCGYTVRTSKKWLDEVGAPHCPKHGEMTVDGASLEDEGDGDTED